MRFAGGSLRVADLKVILRRAGLASSSRNVSAVVRIVTYGSVVEVVVGSDRRAAAARGLVRLVDALGPDAEERQRAAALERAEVGRGADEAVVHVRERRRRVDGGEPPRGSRPGGASVTV